MRRLSLATMESVPPAVRSALDPRDLAIGMVHLGVGGFHRAHQAVYTEDAMTAADQTGWGISAVTQRGPRVRDQLHPQDGLYTLAVRDTENVRYRVVPSVREVLDGSSETDTVLDRIADPAVSVVTLTVTEKAYRLDPGTHRLRTDDPDVRADAAGRTPVTVVGRLVAGLRRRRRADVGPLAVVSCDNLSENGMLLRRAVADYCMLLLRDDELAEWIGESVTFPSTMVDRIVPATTDADRTVIGSVLGLRDEAAVIAEQFSQWVIEDDFRSPRPAWEAAGAMLVPDVRPYELTKLRTLNACHSLLAYLGGLAGIGTIADAVAVEDLAVVARRLAEAEVRPTLPPAKGIDHHDYVDTVLRRFANPALGHTTSQVAADGSLKIGPRLLDTIADAISRGNEPRIATLAIAAWLRHVVVQRTDDNAPLNVDDPAAAAMRAAARGRTDVTAVRPALRAAGISEDLLEDRRFAGLVEYWYVQLDRAGTVATVRAAVE